MTFGELLQRYREEGVSGFKGACEDTIRFEAMEPARHCPLSVALRKNKK